MDQLPFIENTLGGLLEQKAAEHPDKKFITYADRGLSWTYSEFNARVDEFAKGLMAAGVQKNSKVGIWANNIPDWITVFMAAAKIGAWSVTVNTNYKTAELEYLLRNSDIHTLCMIDKYRDSDYVEMIKSLVPEIETTHPFGAIMSTRLPELRNVIVMDDIKRPGMLNSKEVFHMANQIPNAQYNRQKASVDMYDVVNIQYTSGTTGFPKGVMLNHYNIINNSNGIAESMKYTADDVLCVCVPMYHCFGVVLGLCSCLVRSMQMSMVQDFDAKVVLNAIEKDKCTTLYGVPTMYVNELNCEDFDKYDLSSLRTGIMAGSVCPIETMKQVIEKMHMKDIISVYGLTEASPGMTSTRIGHTEEQRITTVGIPLPHITVAVLDVETGKELGDGEVGEVCCRGYNRMTGYYKNPEATSQTIDNDGWLHSGDLGMRDKDGFYHITGRIKDMIIRGGENIYPREIENFIYQMPGVKMVEVVGVPDAKYGEIVGAFIIQQDGFNLTQEDVQEYCKGAIARYKIPKHVFFVDVFPTTGSGKVQKTRLREMAAELVNS